jgi:amino acid transporter
MEIHLDIQMKKKTARGWLGLDMQKLLMSAVITVLTTGTLLQIIATVFLVSYAWLAIAVIFMLIDLIVYCMMVIVYDKLKGGDRYHYNVQNV